MDNFFKVKGTNKITSRIGIGGAPSGGHGWGQRNDASAIEGLLTGLENEIYLSGSDEHGEPLTIVMDSYEFLNWVDIKYIKEQTIKHIKKL